MIVDGVRVGKYVHVDKRMQIPSTHVRYFSGSNHHTVKPIPTHAPQEVPPQVPPPNAGGEEEEALLRVEPEVARALVRQSAGELALGALDGHLFGVWLGGVEWVEWMGRPSSADAVHTHTRPTTNAPSPPLEPPNRVTRAPCTCPPPAP